MTVIPHSGAIKVSTDTERGSDKGMQMNSGIVMKLKLIKAANVDCCVGVN